MCNVHCTPQIVLPTSYKDKRIFIPYAGAYLSLAYAGLRKTGIFILGTLTIMTVDFIGNLIN